MTIAELAGPSAGPDSALSQKVAAMRAAAGWKHSWPRRPQ